MFLLCLSAAEGDTSAAYLQPSNITNTAEPVQDAMSQQDYIHAFACLTPMPLPALGGPTGWRLCHFFLGSQKSLLPRTRWGFTYFIWPGNALNRVVIVSVVNKPWRNADFFLYFQLYLILNCAWSMLNELTPNIHTDDAWSTSCWLLTQTAVSILNPSYVFNSCIQQNSCLPELLCWPVSTFLELEGVAPHLVAPD